MHAEMCHGSIDDNQVHGTGGTFIQVPWQLSWHNLQLFVNIVNLFFMQSCSFYYHLLYTDNTSRVVLRYVSIQFVKMRKIMLEIWPEYLLELNVKFEACFKSHFHYNHIRIQQSTSIWFKNVPIILPNGFQKAFLNVKNVYFFLWIRA